MEVLRIKPIMSEKKAEQYLGEFLGENDYTKLINYDCDVFCEESGNLLAKFRKNKIDKNLIKDSFSSFSKAASQTRNRGISTGKSGHFTLLKDGTFSKTRVSETVNSGIIGYYDRQIRTPFCRTTAYTAQEVESWNKCLPIIKSVSSHFKELVPEKWEYQKEYIDNTSKDFIIKDTVFTTVTVNKNWQTAAHTDKGDLEGGFGNLVVLRKGKYIGGYFVLVRWGIAFDLQNGDLLFTDVHQVHGNTPIHKLEEDSVRISLVMYYRENMLSCGTAEEELKLVKTRKSLKNLNGQKKGKHI